MLCLCLIKEKNDLKKSGLKMFFKHVSTHDVKTV